MRSLHAKQRKEEIRAKATNNISDSVGDEDTIKKILPGIDRGCVYMCVSERKGREKERDDDILMRGSPCWGKLSTKSQK